MRVHYHYQLTVYETQGQKVVEVLKTGLFTNFKFLTKLGTILSTFLEEDQPKEKPTEPEEQST